MVCERVDVVLEVSRLVDSDDPVCAALGERLRAELFSEEYGELGVELGRMFDSLYDDSTLTVRPDAEPPAEKMAALLANAITFRRTWEHRRDRRWSLSEYDLSLASFAAAVGWSDQEIADLIVAHRRKYGETRKGLRVDYLRRTIAKARGRRQ